MRDRRYQRILTAVATQAWALRPETLVAMREVLERRIAGERLSDEEIGERIGAEPGGAQFTARERNAAADAAGRDARRAGLAVLPLRGVIAHRAEAFDDVSGPRGTSTEVFGRQLREQLANPDVGGVVIDVDSPGGTVEGVQELAQIIFDARGDKPIVAVANAQAASAAYWIASQADELVVTPSGEVGSIGVWTAHVDISAKLEELGEDVTLIFAGAHKVDGNPFEPLGEEARADLQASVDAVYGTFLKDVARGRGLSQAVVARDFGQGRMLMARQALAAGMVDRIETLEAAIVRTMRGGRPGNKRGARSASAGTLRAAIQPDRSVVLSRAPLSGDDGAVDTPADDAPSAEPIAAAKPRRRHRHDLTFI